MKHYIIYLFFLLIIGTDITAQNTLIIKAKDKYAFAEIALVYGRDTICKQKILKKKTKID